MKQCNRIELGFLDDIMFLLCQQSRQWMNEGTRGHSGALSVDSLCQLASLLREAVLIRGQDVHALCISVSMRLFTSLCAYRWKHSGTVCTVPRVFFSSCPCVILQFFLHRDCKLTCEALHLYRSHGRYCSLITELFPAFATIELGEDFSAVPVLYRDVLANL